MRIRYQSNLDDVQRDIADLNGRWDDTRNFPVPRKGERIEFCFKGPNGDRLSYELEIVAVTYSIHVGHSLGPSEVVVELHMPATHRESIAEWSTWFRPFRGLDVVAAANAGPGRIEPAWRAAYRSRLTEAPTENEE